MLSPMSGGGTGYGGPERHVTDCNIVESVPLNSPQPLIVRKLKKGDILSVEVDGKSLVAKLEGDKAGALTPSSLLDLLDCIEKGKEYVAVVTTIKGGFCEVEIRPR